MKVVTEFVGGSLLTVIFIASIIFFGLKGLLIFILYFWLQSFFIEFIMSKIKAKLYDHYNNKTSL